MQGVEFVCGSNAADSEASDGSICFGSKVTFIGIRRSDRQGLKSLGDQVSTDVRGVVQAFESDLMARGVAVDLFQMAK